MRKKMTLLGSILVILGAIPATVFLSSQEQDIRQKAALLASFSLDPQSLTKNVGDTFDVKIKIDSADEVVVGADVSISFDPEELEVVDADPSSEGVQITSEKIFPEQVVLANKADNSEGKILLSISTFSSFRGEGAFGSIKFEVRQGGESRVTFDPSPYTKIVRADGENILGITNPGIYTTGIKTEVSTQKEDNKAAGQGRMVNTTNDGFSTGSIKNLFGSGSNFPPLSIFLISGIPIVVGLSMILWGLGIFRRVNYNA